MLVFIKSAIGMIASLLFWPPCLIALLHKTRGVKIKNFRNIFISYYVTIDNVFPELVEIGEDVKLTRNVTILSHFHPTSMISDKYGHMVKKRTIIHDGVFIGIGSIVLPGVEIGEGTVIGACSVVTKNMPAYSICGGNSCRVISIYK